MRMTWLGHSAVHLEIAGRSVLIDPFWTGNPTFPQGWEASLARVDTIVLTHGHDDHIGDTLRLAQKYDATLVAQYELCVWLGGQGLAKTEPMNLGGRIELDGIRYAMVQAFHSAGVVRDGLSIPLGDPAGFVIEGEGSTVYHAGDTAIFGDMALIQRVYRPQVGFLPIGDRFTMGPETAAIACNELLDLKLIVPIHWGTFGLLTGQPEQLKAKVTRGRVHVATPGEPFGLE